MLFIIWEQLWNLKKQNLFSGVSHNHNIIIIIIIISAFIIII